MLPRPFRTVRESRTPLPLAAEIVGCDLSRLRKCTTPRFIGHLMRWHAVDLIQRLTPRLWAVD